MRSNIRKIMAAVMTAMALSTSAAAGTMPLAVSARTTTIRTASTKKTTAKKSSARSAKKSAAKKTTAKKAAAKKSSKKSTAGKAASAPAAQTAPAAGAAQAQAAAGAAQTAPITNGTATEVSRQYIEDCGLDTGYWDVTMSDGTHIYIDGQTGQQISPEE